MWRLLETASRRLTETTPRTSCDFTSLGISTKSSFGNAPPTRSDCFCTCLHTTQFSIRVGQQPRTITRWDKYQFEVLFHASSNINIHKHKLHTKMSRSQVRRAYLHPDGLRCNVISQTFYCGFHRQLSLFRFKRALRRVPKPPKQPEDARFLPSIPAKKIISNNRAEGSEFPSSLSR